MLTAAWSVTAAATDDSGLFVVGATMVLFETTGGTATVAIPVHYARTG